MFGGPAAYIEVIGQHDGTYRTGDLIVTHTQDTYAKGDIVALKVAQRPVILHRRRRRRRATLQGDNNADTNPRYPTDEQIVGKGLDPGPRTRLG